jgi:hypothetical protein
MIEIEIAGAGAGKTHGLAEKLSLAAKMDIKDNKKIFALTFTNAAKKKIVNTLLKIDGLISDKIYIDTIHSFLLNEIIYPYSKFAINEIYTKAVSIPLSPNIKYKQYKKKQLKENQIIHNEDVYQKAKIIIDKENSKHGSIQKKRRVGLIISHISSITNEIFLDEVQDLDEDALRVFEILGLNGIPIYMIGDPKQAIKYPNAFEDFIKKSTRDNSGITKLLPINNETRRIPKEFLFLTNRFCPSNQIQTTLSEAKGCLYYMASDSSKYTNFIKQSIRSNNLIFIEEKDKNYHTHKESKINFPIEVERKIKKIKNFLHLDPDLFIAATLNELIGQVKSDSPANVLAKFMKEFKLRLEPPEYAELKESLQTLISVKDGYLVSSIDAVKGIESDKCVFILNEV